MANINFKKHIWEGWTVGAFIESLEPSFDMIVSGQSWQKPFTTTEELKKWCMENQPQCNQIKKSYQKTCK